MNKLCPHILCFITNFTILLICDGTNLCACIQQNQMILRYTLRFYTFRNTHILHNSIGTFIMIKLFSYFTFFSSLIKKLKLVRFCCEYYYSYIIRKFAVSIVRFEY